MRIDSIILLAFCLACCYSISINTTNPEPAMSRLDTFLLTLMLACVPALLALAFGA